MDKKNYFFEGIIDSTGYRNVNWDELTESNSLCYQMVALESAREELRKFCKALPRCSTTLNCDVCEIIDKIIELDKRIEDLGLLQDELEIDLD